MQRIIFLLTTTIFALSGLALSGNAFAESKKIIKWVDGSGVTHYGDKLPAQEAGRKNSEMNTQGIVLKQNNAPVSKDNIVDQQKIEQDRKDKILLASYTKPEEIDAARDRNLQMDMAAIQALNSQKESITSRTARNNKTAESFSARNKPIPAYLADELRLSKLESANIDKQLAQRKLNMEATRTRYAQDKAQFIALKQSAVDPSGTTSPNATITENPAATGLPASKPVAKK